MSYTPIFPADIWGGLLDRIEPFLLLLCATIQSITPLNISTNAKYSVVKSAMCLQTVERRIHRFESFITPLAERHCATAWDAPKNDSQIISKPMQAT
jgi:hypothetical protein